MKYKVWYDNEDVGEYNTIKEAKTEILDALATGVLVDSVVQIDKNEKEIVLGCVFSVNLVKI